MFPFGVFKVYLSMAVKTAFCAEFPVCAVCVSMMVHVVESVHYIITSMSYLNKKGFIKKKTITPPSFYLINDDIRLEQRVLEHNNYQSTGVEFIKLII